MTKEISPDSFAGSIPNALYSSYASTLERVLVGAIATNGAGEHFSMESAIRAMGHAMREAHDRGNQLFFVGNGGSAGICSHMATDYSKNGGIRSTSLNDGATLTCLGNDYGYEHVFQKQIEWHARSGDIIITISSSGMSQNILNAADQGRSSGCTVFTLSGFSQDNPLRSKGDLNVYLDSTEYGFVEVGHLAVLHAVLDIQMGWVPPARPN